MPSDLFTQRPEDGDGKASGTPRCLMRNDVRTVLDNFESMKTRDSRKAFADRWLSLIADRLDDTWVAVYELCAQVRDQELFRDAGVLGRGKKFDTFEAYFEDLFGKPFSVWVELEATYQFATASCPALKTGPLHTATEKRRSAQDLAADPEVTPAAPQGRPKSDGGKGAISTLKRGSTSASHIVRRLKRDHPEIADALGRGEYPSARAAGIAAGIVKVPSPLDATKKAYLKLSEDDQHAFLMWLKEQ